MKYKTWDNAVIIFLGEIAENVFFFFFERTELLKLLCAYEFIKKGTDIVHLQIIYLV